MLNGFGLFNILLNLHLMTQPSQCLVPGAAEIWDGSNPREAVHTKSGVDPWGSNHPWPSPGASPRNLPGSSDSDWAEASYQQDVLDPQQQHEHEPHQQQQQEQEAGQHQSGLRERTAQQHEQQQQQLQLDQAHDEQSAGSRSTAAVKGQGDETRDEHLDEHDGSLDSGGMQSVDPWCIIMFTDHLHW